MADNTSRQNPACDTNEQQAELTFDQAVDAIYAWVDEQVQLAAPRCEISGRCCRFREYGHRLYISGVEADRLRQTQLPESNAGRDWNLLTVREQCPYQVQGRCEARTARPLGCRIFFCDPNYEQRATEITEEALQRLKYVHEQYGEPWEYRELGAYFEETRFLTNDSEKGLAG